VLPEDEPPSLDVLCISTDASVDVGAEQPAKTFVVIALLQKVKRVPTFSQVVWLLDILLQEKLLQIGLTDFKNALASDSLFLIKYV
jgi:hypothetical protein